MKKIAAVLLTAGSLALAGPASAHDRGGVIVGALIGGAVLGAIVMSALNPAPAVAYAAPAYQAPAYRAPAISRRDISRRRLTVRSRGQSLWRVSTRIRRLRRASVRRRLSRIRFRAAVACRVVSASGARS